MIKIIRSASILPGKTADALAFAHHIAKLIGDKHGKKIELAVPIGGNPSRIAWLSDYADLAEWEALMGKLMADADYMTAIAATAAIFIPGSLHDDIWRTI
jgi:hypothetical protein